MGYSFKISDAVAAPHTEARHQRSGYPAAGTAKKALKRLVDIAAALVGLILMAPLGILVAAMIYATEGGPIFFGHERVGRHGRRFKCYKFRTMVRDSEAVLQAHLKNNPLARAEWEARRKLRNDPRVSRLGEILRKSSVDELPQLFNILRGDMSLVGPRPIVQDELQYYGENARFYLSVRPGLTGLWQTSGRSDTSYSQRVMLDTEYALTYNFWLDARIVLKTAEVVLTREGSY